MTALIFLLLFLGATQTEKCEFDSQFAKLRARVEKLSREIEAPNAIWKNIEECSLVEQEVAHLIRLFGVGATRAGQEKRWETLSQKVQKIGERLINLKKKMEKPRARRSSRCFVAI
jgi:hypothetical protein